MIDHFVLLCFLDVVEVLDCVLLDWRGRPPTTGGLVPAWKQLVDIVRAGCGERIDVWVEGDAARRMGLSDPFGHPRRVCRLTGGVGGNVWSGEGSVAH